MKKVAIITGATGNLGKTVVKKFIELGYLVIAISRTGDKLSKSEFPGVEEYGLDLSNEQKVEGFIKEIIAKHGRIDVALLLAGGFAMGTIEKTNGSDLRSMYSLNFETAYFTARAAFIQMLAQKNGGRVVFIGSKPALSGMDGKGTIAYGLSKSLLFKFSEYLNEEGKEKNVVSFVLAPSIIDTPQNRKDMPDADFLKWVKPEEIAETLEFVCERSGSQLKDTVLKLYGKS